MFFGANIKGKKNAVMFIFGCGRIIGRDCEGWVKGFTPLTKQDFEVKLERARNATWHGRDRIGFRIPNVFQNDI